MPVRIPLVTDPAVRVLLDGIVDYAGLFPPAALGMPEAVRNYARYRGGEAGWMLGRFICGVSQFPDFQTAADPLLPRDVGAIPWRLAAVGAGDHAADADAIAGMNDCHRWSLDECSAVVDTIETRVASPDDVARAHDAFPLELAVYLEVPSDADPRPFVDAIASAGRRAKLRTGGVTAGAFPSPDQVVAFIDACVSARVPFKATAGLHHALHGEYALTYEPDAARAPMFGFLNVFLAAALRAADAAPDEVRRLLTESDPTSLTFTDEAIVWRGQALHRTHLARVREQVAIAFGSCSFIEPVAEARALGAW